jgi:hypothetical protein
MDYARFDYVAQPGDNIPEWMLFPRINDYDKWAIEWGYKRYITDKEDPDSEIPAIDKLIRDSLAANPRLAFGDGIVRKRPASPERGHRSGPDGNQCIGNKEPEIYNGQP